MSDKPNLPNVESLDPKMKGAIEKCLQSALICLIKRMDGKAVDFPVAEIDATGNDVLTFNSNPQTGTITLSVTSKDKVNVQ
ncbi:hypothetical protein EKK58_09180 [Candidatus Dependentiae bacterium]|nr:MAG: hypothetical protein EKK58_09180 [Candidatus Dependentiae bacterium]